MQFQPPSSPGWGQPEPDPLEARVQQPLSQPGFSHQFIPSSQAPQPGLYFSQPQTRYPSFPQQQPSYPVPGQRLPVTPRPPQKAPTKPTKKKLGLGCGVAVVLLVVVIVISVAAQSNTNSSTSTNMSTSTAQATTPPMNTPVHYPPTTQADVRGLAAQGDATAIHAFHQESGGLVGACPQPKVEATVDPGVTGQQLAENALAFFYGQQLDSPCGSLLLVYHTQNEGENGYTAGHLLFDATDASGSPNVDPKATNLTYSLTPDTGDVSGGQEYVVTY